MSRVRDDESGAGGAPSGEAAADALRQSEERFRRIFEYSNDAIFIMDPENDRILDANGQACRMLGYSREELLALPISAVHPGEMQQLRAFTNSVFEEGHGWTDELTCLTRSGESLASEISASIIENDGTTCICASIRDVSERKRAMEALERQSETLENLVAERTERLQHSEERARLLLDINNAIIGSIRREELFRAIAEALEDHVPHGRAVLLLYHEDAETLELYALAGELGDSSVWPVGKTWTPGSIRLWPVIDRREPVLVQDLQEGSPTPLEQQLLDGGIRGLLAVPLLARGRLLGVLGVGSRTPDAYSKNDADFFMQIGAQVALAVEKMLAFEEIEALRSRLEQEKLYLQHEIKTQHNFEEIVGESPALERVLQDVETVAPTEANILIRGETGTGKELIARAIHDLSPRSERALVKVNCAALPAGLIESELFGHERGAFTGALSRKVGRFQLADGGTILLDEVGDLQLELQGKLLRVLQEGDFERVGGTTTIRVSVRVIAATNRDLDKAVAAGEFRSDLFYRLNVFPITLPPLRERGNDIRLLVNYFAMKHSREIGKEISVVPKAAMDRLLAYSWPGNVRELQNVVERAVILSRGEELALGDWFAGSGTEELSGRPLQLNQVQAQHIQDVLQQTGWKVSGKGGAAELLGLKPTTLEYRMKKLGIVRPQ